MKQRLAQLIHDSLHALRNEGYLQLDDLPEAQIERCRDTRHGDYASNIAMVLAKRAKRAPKELAEMICKGLAENTVVKSVQIAGPGFINFHLNDGTTDNVILEILEKQDHYGKNIQPTGQSVLIEFVSANPTGPLHVGHGRGAAYGSCIANLLENAGHKVHREYYVNDAGRQMDILATSVWLRYLQQLGHTLDLPTNVYQGDYIIDIACQLKARYEIDFDTDQPPVVLLDAYENHDSETALDMLIHTCKETLGEQNYRIIHQYALKSIQENIREDLENFKVEFDSWYSEEKLHASGQIEESIEMLKARDLIYQKEGAWWFRSTLYGDEKDRVAVRDNGSMTYFAADIAYHREKFERGFDKVINIFGADHHGYIPRLRAILSAFDIPQERLEVLLVQFANLWRKGEKVQMSTRSGQFVTLQELVEEVGVDAARFFYIMRKSDQHLDFDLTLAASKSNENPVYYIQYAHARICSVFEQLAERGQTWSEENGLQQLALLTDRHEKTLIEHLHQYPETALLAAERLAPHLVANYLRECAQRFHTYYNAVPFIVDDCNLKDARLALITATRQVIRNGMTLLAISTPASM